MSINWDIVSGVAAALATIISLLALRSASRSQAKMDRLAHQSWADDYFRDILNWAGDVCRSISKATHLVDTNDDIARREVLIELSASIDMGRWYFPNHVWGNYGIDKEPAYRGVRQPLLDWVVRAYGLCSGELKVVDQRAALIECQRQFISAIQEVIDPRERAAQISRVQSDYGSVSGRAKVVSPPL